MSAQKTLNLTQHSASQDQVQVGVIDLPEYMQQQVKDLLTFPAVPSADDIRQRAEQLAYLANNASWELADLEASALATYYWGGDEDLAPVPCTMQGGIL